MKLAIFADLHFRAKDLPVISAAWSAAVERCLKEGADHILIAGDVFDTFNVGGREASMGSVFRAFWDGVERFQRARFGHVIVIPGNHDQAGPSQVDALAALDGRENVGVEREPSVVRLRSIGGDDAVAIACLPWISPSRLRADYGDAPGDDIDLRNELLTDLGVRLAMESGPKILLAHCEISGAVNAHGYSLVGGSFELCREDVASLHADYAYLGHYHLRQHLFDSSAPSGAGPAVQRSCSPAVPQSDGATVHAQYVGALCQLSHGDEGAPTGFVILDTQSGLERFIEVDSPRYYTVTTDEYERAVADNQEPWRDGVDRVKIRGERPPSVTPTPTAEAGADLPGHLPDGVVFEAEILRPTTERRTDATLAPDDDPLELLSAWHAANERTEDIEDLRRRGREVLAGAPLDAARLGALDRVDRIRLSNIARHEDVTLDLSEASGLIGIVGRNGSGKTALVEAIPGALYGDTPSRGDLHACMTHGHIGDAKVDMVFKSDGKAYTVERALHRTAKTKRHSAFLRDGADGDGVPDPLADSVADVANSVTNLVGDADVFLATCFESQEGAGDLVRAKPAERKDVFSKLLGSDRWQASSKAASDAAVRAEADLAALDREAAEISGRLATRPSVAADLQRLSAERTRLEAVLADLRAQSDALVAEEARHGEKAGDDDAARRDASAAEDRILQLEVEDDGIANRLGELDAELETQPDTDAAHDALKRLDAEEAILQRLEAARQAAIQRQSEIGARGAAVREQMDALNESHRQVGEDLIRQMDAARDRVRSIDAQIDKKRAYAEHQLQTAQADLQRAEAQAAALDTGEFSSDRCETCRFLADARKARDAVPEIAHRIATLTGKLHNGSVAPELDARRSEAQAETEGLSGEIRQADETHRAAIQPLAAERAELAEAYKAVEIPESPGARLSQVRKERAAHNAVLAAAGERGKLEAEQARLKDRLDQIAREREECAKAFAAAEERVAAAQKANALRAEAATKRRELASESDAAASALREAQEQHAGAIARLQDLDRARERLESMGAQRDRLRIEGDLSRAVAHAFSRDGIPQLVADSAIPQIQGILDELCAELDGRFAITFRTQRETQKGAQKEVLDIIVSGPEGDRDIGTYSGGEKKLLRCVVRIALALFQAQRAGRRLRVFVADEAFDNLDAENAAALLGIFHQLEEHFEQILIVSHSDTLICDLQTVFIVERAGTGTRVRRLGSPASQAHVAASVPDATAEEAAA